MAPQTLANPRVVLSLAGKVCANSLTALRRRIDRARRTRSDVAIDLSEVTLIDKPSLEFLAALDGTGVDVINCPVYIERWLRKENE